MEKINSDSDYNKIMAKADHLMALGSDHVSKGQLAAMKRIEELLPLVADVSEYLTEKSEPTLKIAPTISLRPDISAAVIPGI